MKKSLNVEGDFLEVSTLHSQKANDKAFFGREFN